MTGPLRLALTLSVLGAALVAVAAAALSVGSEIGRAHV